MKIRRRYENKTLRFENGLTLVVGTCIIDGQASLKLRLPEQGWRLTQFFQGGESSGKPGVVVFDREVT